MSFFKYIPIIVIVGIISVGVYFYKFRPEQFSTLRSDLIPQATAQLGTSSKTIQHYIDSLKEKQLKPLGQKIETSKILGVDTSNEKPVHQKAFDYARYEYCKQVIRDFEQVPLQSSNAN